MDQKPLTNPDQTQAVYTTPPHLAEKPSVKKWLSAHTILGVVFVVVALAAIVAGIYYWLIVREIPTDPIKAPPHKELIWQNYQGTEYTFDYPGDWQVSNPTDESLLVLNSPENLEKIKNSNSNPINEVTIRSFASELSLENYVNQLKEQKAITDLESAKFAGFRGYDMTINALGGPSYGIIIDRNRVLYQISFGLKGKKADLNLVDNHIILTFMFKELPSVPIVNSFSSCEAAGYQVANNQCKTPDGLTFAKNSGVCAQVITQAKNPKTGEVKEFPTPCDIPVGWKKV